MRRRIVFRVPPAGEACGFLDAPRRSLRVVPHSLLVKHHHPTHECGVFAVFGHPNAANLTYYGLYALQHRGQESAGIVTANGPNTPFLRHVNMGLVSQVFQAGDLDRLKGTRAVGHVRYSTTGSSNLAKL